MSNNDKSINNELKMNEVFGMRKQLPIECVFSTALSNLLSILSSNEDLVHEEQLVQSILEYIVCFLCEV